jgi:hypothetical protein
MKPARILVCVAFLVGLAVASGVWFFLGRDQPAIDDASSGPEWFKDVTKDVGLDFVHEAGSIGAYFMPQIMGSGAAFLDFDNDGLLDIYLIQNGGPKSTATNRLFKQTADRKFVDVSNGSGLDIVGHGMGVAIGDANNDGFVDVVVTEYGRTRLFLNQGNGTFKEITAESGLDNPLWGTSVSFVDFDRDGWLDLVVTNYVDYDPAWACQGIGSRRDYCHPSQFQGRVTKVFHNVSKSNPKTIRFEDVTISSGLSKAPGPGLGVVCADFNGDGWPDLFIANDAKPNHLWINQKDGTFREEAIRRGVAYNAMGNAEAGMGVAIGDVDGDGLFDLFVTHLSEETHTLWWQGPRGRFTDRTAFSGLTVPKWRGTGFGTILADFDNDGRLDIAVANGRVSRATAGAPAPNAFFQAYAERNQLFANEGAGRFGDVSAANPTFCGSAAVSRGLVCGDFDGDGALDLLVTSVAGPVKLYRNVAPRRGHWLLVRALDPELRRDAYGAEITVHAGDRRWTRLLNPGQSYLCSGDPRAHFGFGETAQVDRIVVRWPDGTSEAFPGPTLDRSIVLRKGHGK